MIWELEERLLITRKQKTDVSECPQVAAETIPIQVEMTSYRFFRKQVQGDPYGHGIVYVDSKFEVAFNCKVGLLPRPATEL